ncbi:MAG: SMP-30/gluconolactonase/LRE family protein [Chloroflexota bacterium]
MLNVEIKNDRFREIVDIEAGIEQVITGFDFLEGPIYHPAYGSVLFSDIMGNSLYSWHPENGMSKRRINSYMANGNAYDHQGRFVTCEHATSRVTRTNVTTNVYEVLATSHDGKQLNSPNDIVVKQDGTLYFTDPTSGRSAGFGVPREQELDFQGVYRLDPDSKELTLLIDDFSKPNGLCFNKDQTLLFVNDTDRQHIRVFDVLENGTLENGRLFADLEGDLPGVADGMKIDEDENVYCCGPGGIQVFSKDGTALGTIIMPEKTANFVFGDADCKSLYVTASTSLYRLRVKVPGYLTFKPAE